MSQLERLNRIEQMLLNAPSVSIEHLQDTLEVSRAKHKRDLDFLHARLHALMNTITTPLPVDM